MTQIPRPVSLMRWVRGVLARETSASRPPPLAPLARGLWGFAQPLLGMRLLLRTPDLLGRSLAPAIGVAILCWFATDAAGPAHTFTRWLAFMASYAAAAQLPPVILSRLYARIAADAHRILGLGDAVPAPEKLWDACVGALQQILCVAVGVAPWIAILGAIPLVGPAWAIGLEVAWVIHWTIVDVLVNARFGPQTRELGEIETGEDPWFLAPYRSHLLPAPIRWLLLPGKWSAKFAARCSTGVRREIDLIAAEPAAAIGFGLASALLLAIPLINVLFRPAVVIGAVTFRARLISSVDGDRKASPQEEGLRPDLGPARP